MWSRKRLDLGWDDLLVAAHGSCVADDRESLADRLEALWSPAGDALACLSVRSAFDLLLTALDLPRGSELLVSAVTIGGMLQIIEAHGLRAVPADLDFATMSPTCEALERGLSARTQAIVVAHLFGGRIDLRQIAEFARRRGLLLIEDAAQVFAGLDYTGHPAADVSLFSFGPIKTATALGGALARIRDRRLQIRMRSLHWHWPVQSRRDFGWRVAKHAALKAASSRPAYGAFVRGCRLMGHDHDRIVNDSVRAFAEGDILARIRQQPCAPLLSLLRRRLERFDIRGIDARVRRAERVISGACSYRFPGSACRPHFHWVLPIWSDDPWGLIAALAAVGFDATQGQSLTVVPPPDDRPDLDPLTARATLGGTVFVPCYAQMSLRTVDRLARACLEIRFGRVFPKIIRPKFREDGNRFGPRA